MPTWRRGCRPRRSGRPACWRPQPVKWGRGRGTTRTVAAAVCRRWLAVGVAMTAATTLRKHPGRRVRDRDPHRRGLARAPRLPMTQKRGGVPRQRPWLASSASIRLSYDWRSASHRPRHGGTAVADGDAVAHALADDHPARRRALGHHQVRQRRRVRGPRGGRVGDDRRARGSASGPGTAAPAPAAAASARAGHELVGDRAVELGSLARQSDRGATPGASPPGCRCRRRPPGATSRTGRAKASSRGAVSAERERRRVVARGA